MSRKLWNLLEEKDVRKKTWKEEREIVKKGMSTVRT